MFSTSDDENGQNSKAETDSRVKSAEAADSEAYKIHLSKDLSQKSLLVVAGILLFLLVGLTLYDFTHQSNVVIWIGGSLRIIAWGILMLHYWNRRQENIKRIYTEASDYKAIMAVLIIGLLGSCVNFGGRVMMISCEHDPEFYAHHPDYSQRYDLLQCNPLEGTGLLPSYFYILVVAVNFAQLALNFQDVVGLFVAWCLVAGTLLWFQIVFGFFLTLLDDCVVLSFIYCSYVLSVKNKENFFHMREKIAADILALEVKGNIKIMENRINDMRDLIGNISHDLKTPMHAFSMELNSLQEQLEQPGKCPSQIARLNINSVLTLKDTCAFMLMIINRGLDYTKVSLGKTLVPQKSTVSLLKAMSWAVDCVKRTTQGGATLVLDSLPDGICSHVITDYQWLVENVLCLASNAVKFSMAGIIHVRCNISTENSNYLNFEVEDTGIGIRDELRATLFHPFQKTQSISGGTGLGLYSLSKRVDALSGQYGIRNRKDGFEGSLFWFTIPYIPDVNAVCEEGDPPTRPNPLTAALCADKLMIESLEDDEEDENKNKNKKTILLVDDSLVIQKTTKRILAKCGYEVDVASNGLLGLNALIERRYDLVLMGKNCDSSAHAIHG
jgi:signal transduction histidine kinase